MKLVLDMSSNEYHSEREHFSSSQLKDILDSNELFIKKHVTREIPREDNIPVFDIGTYFHTAILEPHLIEKECAVYEGTRIGKKWDDFKKLHKGKAIITLNEKKKAINCVEAIRQCPISMAYVNLGTPEVSAFLSLYIWYDGIYYIKEDDAYFMSYDGWVKCSDKQSEAVLEGIRLGEAVMVGVKVRADSIDLNGCSLSDLKSASGDVVDEFKIQYKTSDLNYDLSAALYIDIFSAVVGHPYTDFVWLYASKELHEKLKAPFGKPWRASENNIRVGRGKWTKAILDIALLKVNNWKLDNKKVTLDDLEPKEHELVWLKKKHLTTDGSYGLSDLSDIKKQIELDKLKPVKESSLATNEGNDMKITTVSYRRSFKIAEYENETIGFDAVLEEGENVFDAVTELKHQVDASRTGAAPTKEKEKKAKLEVAKEETKKEEPKKEEKAKKEKKVEATKYSATDEKHKASLGSLLDKMTPGWREKDAVKKHAKKSSGELTGSDFMDGEGKILDSFVDAVKAKMKDHIQDEEEDDGDL